jgi:DNA (cytosine-5)-methyltransferase 1
MFRVIREIQSSWIIGENVPGIIGMELENICLALESEGYEVQPFIIPSASIGAWDKRDRIWIIAHNNKFGCNNEQKGQIKTIQNEIRNNKIEKQGGGKQQCGTGQSDIIITDTQEQRIRQLSVQQWRQNKASNINSNRETKINPHIESTISEQSGETRSGRETEQERSSEQTNWSRPWIEVASELCGSNARVPHRMDRIKSLGNSVNPYVAYQIFKAIEETNNKLNENKI